MIKRKKRIRIFAALLCLLLLPTIPATAASPVCGSELDGYSVALTQGVTAYETTYWTGNDLRTEHYVMSTPNSALRVKVVGGEQLCSADSVEPRAAARAAEGERVLCALNGAYFSVATKEPVGLVVENSVLRASDEGLNALGFREDGSVLFGRPALTMQLAMDNAQLHVDALNKGYAEGVVLYTADFFEGSVIGGCNVVCTASAPLTMSGNVTLTVTACTEEAMRVPAGKILLHSEDAYAPMLSDLRPGDTLTLEISSAEGWETVDSALSILYPLVTDGVAERGLEKTAAPRSAIGVRADGTLVFYTIDGRQSGYSIGLGMDALAQRMLELGCVQAGCLDGGGSTDLCAALPGEAGLVHLGKPSDGKARDVVSHIFLVADKMPVGPAASLALYPLTIRAMVGAEQALRTLAADAAGNAVSLPANLSYSVSGGLGRVENGIFYAERAGTGSITVSAPGVASAQIPIRIVEAPDEFALYGERYGRLTTALTLAPGEEVDLTVRAKWQHMPLLTADKAFAWELEPSVGEVDGGGHLIPGEDSAQGMLTVAAGDKTVEIPITVRGELPFYDVKKADACYEAVKYVYDNAVFFGTGETSFEPETVMDRAMLVTVLWRLSGRPEAETPAGFADVAPESWYGPAVAWAAEQRIVAGYSAEQFGPTDNLTKEQILAILCRWCGAETPAEPTLDQFSDAAEAGAWALGALSWATGPEQRLVDADELGALRPRDAMPRAAVADVMMRFLRQNDVPEIYVQPPEESAE